MRNQKAFSGLSLELQAKVIELDGKLTANKKRKEAAEKAKKEAEQRIAAEVAFNELAAALETVGAVVHTAVKAGIAGYLAIQRQNLATAGQELTAADAEFRDLQSELQPNGDALSVLWSYREKYRRDPVVYADVNPVDDVDAFERLVGEELSQTRQLLQERKPEELSRYRFRCADEYIGLCAGQELALAADDIRAARDILAELRAEALASGTAVV